MELPTKTAAFLKIFDVCRKDFWDRMLRYWFSLNMLNSIDQLQLTLSTKTRQTTALKACSHLIPHFCLFHE